MAEVEIPDDRDLVAAEYAIGVLDGDEWAAASARYDHDADFAAEVRRWRQRLSPLYRDVADEDVAPPLWERIAAATRPRAAPPAQRLAAWRASAVAATALAAGLAAVLVLQSVRVAPPAEPRVVTRVVAAPIAPVVFAQLLEPGGKGNVVARYDAADARLHVRASDLPKSGGTPELWVIAEGGAPKSLGLIERSGSRSLAIDPAVRPLLRAGATLAITLEDAATAPHRAPTGDILASGTIARL